MYVGADCFKMLAMSFINCSEVENIKSFLESNVNISIYSSELQVYILTTAVKGLRLLYI